jgi:NADPH:quinone reductase-like Zn-dependent oxidoreductase
MRSKPEDREEIERLFREKKLYPVTENFFTLDKSAEAFELAENGKPRVKIIVRI